MNEPASAVSGKKRSFLKPVAWAAGGLLLLLVVAFFVVTSPAFFKSAILPRASQALNARITVADASISPFSQVILRNVRVETAPASGVTGTNPLFEAQEVRAVYSLMEILRGNLKIAEISLSSPVVEIIQNADGTSNLDPLLKAQKPERKATPSQGSEAPKIDLGKLVLSNGTVRVVKRYAGGSQDLTTLSNLNLRVENVQNGRTGKLTVESGMLVQNNPPAPGTNGLLQAKLAGDFTFELSADLKPTTVKGNSTFSVQRAAGAMSDLADLGATVVCEVAPTEIRQLSLRFQKSATPLGEVRASGPFDMAKMEGRLNFEIRAIDRQVLNLAGAAQGIDFNSTTVNSTNQIEFARAGQVITTVGQFNLAQFSVTRTNQTTPKVDLRVDYNLTVNRDAKSALLQALQMTGTQNSRPLLQAALNKPMTVAWGGVTNAAPDSSLSLEVTGLNLADWKPFLGGAVQAGVVDLNAKLVSEQAGQQQAVSGTLRLENFTGEYGQYRFAQFAMSLDCDLAVKNQLLEIHKLGGSITQNGLPGGTFDVSGSYHLTKKAGDLTLKLADLNQNALRPFLAPALGEKTLTSVTIKADAAARYDANGASSVKGELQVTNLLVHDPAGKLSKTPLAAGLKLNGTLANQVLEIRQLLLSLSPTDRAQNQLQLAGKVDMAKSNAITGNLKLTSDALDVTPYYDLFAENQAKTKAGGGDAPKAPPTAQPQTPQTEVPATRLPFQNFSCDLSIGRLYLREVSISNWTAAIKLDGSQVHVTPFKLSLNGSPVSLNADVDLGVPGYQYDLKFNADKIPVAPLANTFSPDYRGRAKGDLTAGAQIKGIGTTGTSLQKSLSGQVGVLFTNADIQIVGPKAKAFLTPISLLLGAPELLSSPVSWLGVQTTMGNGSINLKQFAVESQAFTAETQGQIPIAPVLGSSPLQNFPMTFALRRPLAQKIRMVPSNTPPNAKYVRLPSFIQVAGTLDNPKPELNKTALLGAGLQILTEKIPGLNEKTGGLLKGVGGFLPGTKPADATQPAAPPAGAQPAPATPPKFNPFDLLKKPKP